jgi:tetratricopeptide (TPR) repeat protein
MTAPKQSRQSNRKQWSIRKTTSEIEWKKMLGLSLALMGLVWGVFGPTLGHEFVNFDDQIYVYENAVVSRGLTWEGVVWAFTQSHASNWHPATWLSHMLDCQLYELRPWGHHLSNVLLHGVNAVLLLLLLRQMTGAVWRSAVVAAVFAVHPLRVESVAWVAERKDVLSGLFFLLTLMAYVRYARLPWSVKRYGVMLGLFALGLMAKPMLVTLPLVLLLLDYWPLGRWEVKAGEPVCGGNRWRIPRRLIVEKIPLLILAALSCVATLLAQKDSMESLGNFSFLQRLANALDACFVYLRQMAWPSGLAVYYPYPTSPPNLGKSILELILIVSISWIAWQRRRRCPYLWAGWLWYLVMLVPVIGIIQVGAQAHADRYTYLPQIGLVVAGVWWAAESLAAGRLRKAMGAAVFMAAILGLGFLARHQVSFWRNSEVLWTRALACTAGNFMAHNSLGHIFQTRGQANEAIDQFYKALEAAPHYANAHNNLGIALAQQGKTEEALVHFKKTVKINPRFSRAYNNQGIIYFQKGLWEEAIIQFKKTLEIEPGLASTHHQLGRALFHKGENEEAMAHYRKALEINPRLDEAHGDLAMVLFKKEEFPKAVLHFQRALEINPRNIKARINLAWIWATHPEEAIRRGSAAVSLAEETGRFFNSLNPVFQDVLAAAYAEAGRFQDAVWTLQQAIFLNETAGKDASDLRKRLDLYRAGMPFRDAGKGTVLELEPEKPK